MVVTNAIYDPLLAGDYDLGGLRYEYWPSLETASRKIMLVLHGRGDTGVGYHWLPEALAEDRFSYVFFDAPDRYGMGCSWYDVAPNQGPGVVRSRAALFRAIESLRALGARSEDIFLFGFSQGALMTVDVGCRYPARLGGLVALSGYVFFADEYPAAFSPVATQQRWFAAHGRQDDVLGFESSRAGLARLNGHGLVMEWREYDIAHTIDPEREMDDIRDFLLRQIDGN